MNRIRNNRIIATYEQAGVISDYEAKYALEKAKEFVKFIKNRVSKR